MSKPLYHRWVYSPRTDKVTMSDNKETHPARVRTHGDLAKEIDDSNAIHGYAFRIGGGYRILGYDHKPLTDPFIKRRVEKELTNVK